MEILSQIDAELQKDLLNFVKEQDEKSKNGKVVFGDYLLNDLLKMLISGKCKITGLMKPRQVQRQELCLRQKTQYTISRGMP